MLMGMLLTSKVVVKPVPSVGRDLAVAEEEEELGFR